MRLLGGDIWFTSQPGEGSRFVFYVPLEHSEEDLEAARAELESAAESDAVRDAEPDETLLAEEDEDAGSLQQAVLWPWGEAADGTEGWSDGFATEGEVAGDGFPSWAETISSSYGPTRAREDA